MSRNAGVSTKWRREEMEAITWCLFVSSSHIAVVSQGVQGAKSQTSVSTDFNLIFKDFYILYFVIM